MTKVQDIWIEQCAAARDILIRHGTRSALDYLVGEKLMTYIAVAEQHPEFARELPKFVAGVRAVFDIKTLRKYVVHMESMYHEGEKAAREAHEAYDEQDMELFDGPEEWVREGERLAQIKELLITDRLGTA